MLDLTHSKLTFLARYNNKPLLKCWWC